MILSKIKNAIFNDSFEKRVHSIQNGGIAKIEPYEYEQLRIFIYKNNVTFKELKFFAEVIKDSKFWITFLQTNTNTLDFEFFLLGTYFPHIHDNLNNKKTIDSYFSGYLFYRFIILDLTLLANFIDHKNQLLNSPLFTRYEQIDFLNQMSFPDYLEYAKKAYAFIKDTITMKDRFNLIYKCFSEIVLTHSYKDFEASKNDICEFIKFLELDVDRMLAIGGLVNFIQHPNDIHQALYRYCNIYDDSEPINPIEYYFNECSPLTQYDAYNISFELDKKTEVIEYSYD